MVKRAIAMVGVLAALVVAGGCATYGAKWVPVSLRTEPADRPARAFLVPVEVWAEIPEVADAVQPYAPRDAETFRKMLERYRVTSSRTPVTANAMPYQTMYVVEYGGKYQWTKIRPKAGEKNDFGIVLE